MTYKRRKRTKNDGLGPILDGDFLDAGGFMFMDGNSDEFEKGAAIARMVHDGRGGQAGHRPGFAFAGPPMVTDENLENLNAAAELAYQERTASLGRLLHGQKGTTMGHGGKVPSSPPHPIDPKTATELARKANTAYVEKIERLRNAYKENRGA
jgi:hypothetical protein